MTRRRARRRAVIRRRRLVVLASALALGVSGGAVVRGGLPWTGAEPHDAPDVAVAAPGEDPDDARFAAALLPPQEGDVGEPRATVSGRDDGEGDKGGGAAQPCRPEPLERTLAGEGPAVGGAALGAGALGCHVPAWQALPPTGLEAQEPERLLVLLTREQPVDPLEYAPDDLVDVRGGPYQVRGEVADQLEALLRTAADEGHPSLVVTSGYRSYQTQFGTFEDWVGRLGPERAEKLSARPGYSEHQLGLAVDLAGTCSYQCFGQTEEAAWVAGNAHRWGFIISYPEDGEEITGYAWEPWHLRYVGPRAAWGMHLADEPYWQRFQPQAARAAGLD